MLHVAKVFLRETKFNSYWKYTRKSDMIFVYKVCAVRLLAIIHCNMRACVDDLSLPLFWSVICCFACVLLLYRPFSHVGIFPAFLRAEAYYPAGQE